MAAVVLVVIPIVVAIYLAGRDVVRPPARYTTSADILIPARDPKTGSTPSRVPPVLLQGQLELARSRGVLDVTLQAAGLDPELDHKLGFDAKLNETSSIMTLSVSAPKPELAAAVLNEYIVAYSDGRRQSVLDAAVELQGIEARVIDVLRRKLERVEAQMRELGLPFLPRVPDGTPLEAGPGASNEAILLLYERNSILNEMQRRQVDYALQSTRAAIPAAFTTVVQKRSAARITPPPPSPLIPLLEIVGIGLLLAIALPVLFDRFDFTITEVRVAPDAIRARLLATIPHLPRRAQDGFVPPGSSWASAFRSLAATSLATDRLPKAIMVTSPLDETQDVVAANFAVGLASLGVTVALVGTVPRQAWFHPSEVPAEDEPEAFVYVDIDAADAGEPETTAGSGGGRPDAAAPTELEGGVSGATEREEVRTATAPAPVAQAAVLPDLDLSDVPTFPELLAHAEAGRLTGQFRSRLATGDVPNLYVIPPGSEDADTLDGLPPLLDALARNEIDVTVLAGPSLLEDPNATIMAWSTRHVLWALEVGRANVRDAQLAAERLELAGVAPFGLALVKRHA
ncbi:MAG: hypothetical protein ACT4OV_02665 [Microthrixaceae bacterium]